MKKLILVITIILVLSLTAACFVGCSNSDKEVDYASKTSYTVGILQLVQHEALDAATQGFMDTLKALVEAQGKTIKFDVQNASGEQTLCNTIATNFVSKNVDLIMANATPALQACANATVNIPILGTSITEYGVALGLKNFNGTVGGNISGTSDLAPLSAQAAMFKELLPEVKKVGLLYCSAEANSKYQIDEVETELKKLGYQTKVYSFTDSNDITAILKAMATEVEAVYIPTDNTCASNATTIDSVCRDKKLPIIAGEEGICRGCGIATLSISYYGLGQKTGEMAAEILLNNKNISEMPIDYYRNPVYVYNKEICKAIGLDVTKFPAKYTALATQE